MIAFVITGNLSQYRYWYIDDVTIKAPAVLGWRNRGISDDWNTATNWG